MYIPLRVHGHHSLLTGVDSPTILLERSAMLGLSAMALTDIDSTAGWIDLLRSAPESGVRPILGAEISDPSGEPGRIVALVQDEQGFRNLNKLVSARQLGRDPGSWGSDLGATEEDFDAVLAAAEFQEGLIFLVDHPRLLIGLMGRVPPEQVLAAISPASLRSRPGRNGGCAPDEAELEPVKVPPPARAVPATELLEAARVCSFGAVAVPDVYYAGPVGEFDHRVRVAIKHNALIDDLPEEWLAEAGSHLLTGREMCALYSPLGDLPGPWGDSAPPGVPAIVARTLEVAARCEYSPPLDRVLFPKIELEPGESAYSKLCELSFDGAQKRYRPLRPEVVRRLDYELSTIDDLGFAPYFLLVQRIAEYARSAGIPCVGRGSAADSLVAYCLELTDADPFRYQLIFERFLNPSRQDRPDIDLDFCWRRRDEVTSHVYELFGAHRTAMISTLNCFGLRAAFRETALAHGFPPAEVGRWSKVLPHQVPGASEVVFDGASVFSEATVAEESEEHRERGAGENPIELALRSTPEARDFPHDDERWSRVVRDARNLLDTPRHFGLHPGGVVVSPGPITDFVACQRAAKGVVVTQFDKDAVEAIGLVKMDLLGNRALTVLDDCVNELRKKGIEIDLEELPEDDPATGDTLAEGRSLACFQVESPGMRNLLQQTGARDMDAVIQAVALIRPGPAGSGMKDAYVRRFRGLEAPTPPHPRLTDVLRDTFGVLLYQEDVMQVASVMAGMELAEADQLRRALQKRRSADLEPLARRFREGCAAEGISSEKIEHIWELVTNFASFGFCKAHAVTYGRIAYRAVWLKTHHPAVYMTAFLNSYTGYYRTRVYVEEARRLGVTILPPEINRSGIDFEIEWLKRRDQAARSKIPALRLGLGTIKGLSSALLDSILRERASHGPFLSLPDFLERSGVHTDEAEHLIQCGALDSFDRTRPELLWRLHLLRAPKRGVPAELSRGGAEGLDRGQLDACRATPGERTEAALATARASTTGWGGGIGLGRAALAPGESARLFPEPELPALVLPGLPDLSRRERGALEYELMGLTVTDHPTAIFSSPADRRLGARSPVNPQPCSAMKQLASGRITLRGWLAASRRVRTKNGEWMRFLTLEDPSGLAEAVLFPEVYRRDGHHLNQFGGVCVTGVVQDQLGACTLEVERIW
jgi:DNA-directed DNA polymerase III PolC